MVRIVPEDFIIMAHRGASGYELENSYAAFNKAIELGAPMIETDVQETADGILILMHDSKIKRTTFGKGKIQNLSIQEKKLQMMWPYRLLKNWRAILMLVLM